MAQYQAGMLVVYGKLGVHEIETVGLQSFCGKPAKITMLFALILRIPTTTAISPRQKKVLCARCPGTAGGSRFGTHQRGALMSKNNGISKRSNESGWLFSGRCVSDTPSCLGKIPVEPLNARLDKDSRSNWSKYQICSIALLLYTF